MIAIAPVRKQVTVGASQQRAFAMFTNVDAPGKALRLRGALGPFQGLGVEGSLTWTLKAGANGTDISVSYLLGGYAKDGFEGASKAADHVLDEQIEHLRKFIET